MGIEPRPCYQKGMKRVDPKRVALIEMLGGFPAVAVAVSGGVDSLTLAAAAHEALGAGAELYHAVSPAVPQEATGRLGQLADERGWRLQTLDAGELANADYLANPIDRCFFCKGQLYQSIAALTAAPILSGTNLEDLGDYRPGLRAAEQHRVRHPFVELGIDKAEVRRLARSFGLGALAELPAGPCLASRIETGIPIEAAALGAVEAGEALVREQLEAAVVRCRLRRSAVVIELDPGALASLSASSRAQLGARVAACFQVAGIAHPVLFAPYQMGSAFVGPRD